jgi:hypothetical protein
MKQFTVLFLLLSLVSCRYFEKKVPDENELLQQELQKINWNEVDEFPSVLQCDSIEDQAIKKQCFFDYLTQTIQARIGIDTLRIVYPELDTLEIKVTIHPDARLQFESQFSNDSVSYNKSKIDSILKTRLTDFPQIEPAIKRGIKVKTQFVLPVIITAKK